MCQQPASAQGYYGVLNPRTLNAFTLEWVSLLLLVLQVVFSVRRSKRPHRSEPKLSHNRLAGLGKREF